MFVRLLALNAIIVVSGGFAQEPATPPAVGYKDSFQLNVFAGLTEGVDSFVELTNAGFHKTIPLDHGNICVNVYVFNPDETLCSCCACPISQNSYAKLGVNILARCPVPAAATASGVFRFTPLNNGTLKVVATTPANPDARNCNPTQLQVGTLLGGTGATYTPSAFAAGLRVWATNSASKTNFEKVALSPLERDNLNTLCGNLRQSTNGFAGGICPSCP